MKDLKQEQEWESKRDSTRVKERAKVRERDRDRGRCTETHRERKTLLADYCPGKCCLLLPEKHK